jgi:hypothetical protein
MSYLQPLEVIQLTLSELTTLSAGNGKDVITVPCDMEIYSVHMKLGTTGGTSGNTDVTVYYTAPSGGSTSSGALWTVGAGVGRIAHNATNKYLDFTRASMDITFIERGGTLSLNVINVPGTASTNLTITITGAPIKP